MEEEKVEEKSISQQIRELLKKSGYTVTHEFTGDHSVEEAVARMIRSHT